MSSTIFIWSILEYFVQFKPTRLLAHPSHECLFPSISPLTGTQEIHTHTKLNERDLNSFTRYPCSLWCTFTFPIRSCYLGTFHSDIIRWATSAKVSGMCPDNNFHYVSDYLWVKWNRIFPVLVFWLSQTFKFFTYGILIIITMMTFYNSETSHLWFLWRKTRYKRFLFCYARRHSCVWVLNVFSKTSVKSWHIQNTVGCLFTSQKLSFTNFWYFEKIYASPEKCLCLIDIN